MCEVFKPKIASADKEKYLRAFAANVENYDDNTDDLGKEICYSKLKSAKTFEETIAIIENTNKSLTVNNSAIIIILFMCTFFSLTLLIVFFKKR